MLTAGGKCTLLPERNVTEMRGEKEEKEPVSLVSATFSERLTWNWTHKNTHSPRAIVCSISLWRMYSKKKSVWSRKTLHKTNKHKWCCIQTCLSGGEQKSIWCDSGADVHSRGNVLFMLGFWHSPGSRTGDQNTCTVWVNLSSLGLKMVGNTWQCGYTNPQNM